jgi:hypothetical protein
VINVFDINGRYISSSSKCIGKGPREYFILQDITYNKDNDCINILDPFYYIVTYDIHFNFISRIKIQHEDKLVFRTLAHLYNDIYALMYNRFDVDGDKVFLYDIKKNEIIKQLSYDGLISYIGSFYPFKPAENVLYFIPPETNNNIYTFNKETNELELAMYVHSNRYLSINDTKGYDLRASETNNYFTGEINKFLCWNKIINQQYLISTFFKQLKLYMNICNLETKTNHTYSFDFSFDNNNLYFPVPHFFALEDNIVYALIQPFHISKFVDIDLLSNSEILESIKEDDNPVIVKYYLK